MKQDQSQRGMFETAVLTSAIVVAIWHGAASGQSGPFLKVDINGAGSPNTSSGWTGWIPPDNQTSMARTFSGLPTAAAGADGEVGVVILSGNYGFQTRNRGVPQQDEFVQQDGLPVGYVFSDFLFSPVFGSGTPSAQGQNHIALEFNGLVPGKSYSAGWYAFDNNNGYPGNQSNPVAMRITSVRPPAFNDIPEHTVLRWSSPFTPDPSGGTNPPPPPARLSVTANATGTAVLWGWAGTGIAGDVNASASYLNGFTLELERLLGDLNDSGSLDAGDIDLLFGAANGPVPPADTQFDLNDDGVVNTVAGSAGSDADHWVEVIRGTRYGDADLDGSVGFSDLLSLARNYNTTSLAGWASGDFNGDRAVGFADLLVLARNYGFSGAGAASVILPTDVGSEFASDWVLASSQIPEPTSMAAMLLPATLLLRRRSDAAHPRHRKSQ